MIPHKHRCEYLLQFKFIIFSICASLVFNPVYGQIKPSIQNLEQELSKSIKQKNDAMALQYSLELANHYYSEKQYTTALDYYSQSVKYSKNTKDLTKQYQVYHGLGLTYVALKNYRKATDAFEQSVKRAIALHDKSLEAEARYALGSAEASAGQFKNAITTFESILALAIESKDEPLQLDCYQKLTLYYQKAGNVEKSKYYQNLYTQIISSRNSEDQARQREVQARKKVTELKKQVQLSESEKAVTNTKLLEQTEMLKQAEDSLLKIETINRERLMQIELLNKERELSELKIREQNVMIKNEQLVRNSIIVVVALAAILIGVVIVDFRKQISANKKIHAQNEAIKSSINYASRIQDAMLQKSNHWDALAKEFFVLLKPRDTVSGDFYWFSEIKSNSSHRDYAFAAVDCTGHGVPGAFMSMIGMKALNEITGRGITETNEILSAMHTEIRNALHQEDTGNNDGMDLALCIYRNTTNTLEFSGARNPLVYIQNNELFQVKGDVHPIGGSKSKAEIPFKRHEIKVLTPTYIYLFSDGYKDQFGGPKNSKFMSKKFTQLLHDIHQKPMAEQKEILDVTIEKWKGQHHQTDDILVLGIKIIPQITG